MKNLSIEEWPQYLAERKALRDQIVQYALNHPEVSYTQMAERFGIDPKLLGYYTRKAGIRRVQGRKPKGAK